MEPIGTVQQINLYPVKSMRGLSVEKATCSWYGLDGDRKYAFVHQDYQDAKTGFPWLTGRELPQLLQYQPNFVYPEAPLKSDILVEIPSGKQVALESQELKDTLLSRYGKPVTLLKLKRGTFDCMPISLLTQTSLQTLQSYFTRPLDIRRFRANIIINTSSALSFPEFDWLNGLIRFGERPDSAQLRINYPADRCMMVNLDPETGASQPDILKTVVNEADGCLSVYASVQQIGRIEVGDRLFFQRDE